MKLRRITSLTFGLLASVLISAAVHAQTEAEVKANYTKTEQTVTIHEFTRRSTCESARCMGCSLFEGWPNA
jgi:hypothetical protein